MKPTHEPPQADGSLDDSSFKFYKTSQSEPSQVEELRQQIDSITWNGQPLKDLLGSSHILAICSFVQSRDASLIREARVDELRRIPRLTDMNQIGKMTQQTEVIDQRISELTGNKGDIK